jgi:hypothetical protein
MASRRRTAAASKTLVPATTKEAVSKIFTQFTPSRRFREANEARTRIEVVNGVLSALGWTDKDIEPEAPSGTGEFLDYELWAQDQPWMVVEAKRAGVTFDLSEGTKKSASHLRPIDALMKQGGTALRDAMKQAATYCNDKGIPLACVTNGFQWLFFRGLSSKRRAWTGGSALVFAGSEEVVARFDDFLRSLGKPWAGTTYLPEFLDKPPSGTLPAPTVPRDFFSTRRASADPNRVAILRSVSDYLLGDMGRRGSRTCGGGLDCSEAKDGSTASDSAAIGRERAFNSRFRAVHRSVVTRSARSATTATASVGHHPVDDPS